MSETLLEQSSKLEIEFQHLEILDNENDSCSQQTVMNSYDSQNKNRDENQKKGKSTLFSSIINLLNTAAGAGMLGLPAAYAGSGYVGGTILMLLAGFFSYNGLCLLSFSAERARLFQLEKNRRDVYQASFYSVASAALPEFTILIDFAVAIKCFGVATGYFITVADCMVASFHYILFHDSESLDPSHEFDNDNENFMSPTMLLSRHFWVFIALVFVSPISFFKTLDALKFTSLFSLFLIYCLAIGIILYAQGVFHPCPSSYTISNHIYTSFHSSNIVSKNNDDMTLSCHGTTTLVSGLGKTLSNLPVFVFSFTCHQNVFSIYNELSNRTQSRLKKVIQTSIISALLLYFAVAIEGYRTFGNHVDGDILLNYPQTIQVTLMRISIGIMVLLSYPLQLDPSRRCIISLVQEWKRIRLRKEQMHSIKASNNIHENEQVIIVESSSPQLLSHMDENSSEIHDVNYEESLPLTSFPSLTSDLSNTKIDVHSINKMGAATGEPNNEDQCGNAQHYILHDRILFNIITITFLLGSFLIAMLVSDLHIVLGVVGATGSTMVTYILPGAIYIKLHPEQLFHRNRWKCLAYVQLALGIVIVPTALYFVLFQGSSA